jgi:hypothetical protein
MTKMIIILVLMMMSSCGWDDRKIDGRIVKMDGKYYRLENRMGRVYAFEEIDMDTIIVYDKRK